jgi:hypothetical protein
MHCCSSNFPWRSWLSPLLQRVFREAEEVAKKFRDLNPAHVESSSQGDMDDAAAAAASSVKPVKPISNWEWLDFGDTGAGAGVL